VEPITAYVDVLPTLIELCEIQPPQGVKFDGRSIVPLLSGSVPSDWPDRILVTDSQRVKDPIKWKSSAVMTSRWRLNNGKELYDIKQDPGQKRDIASQHPDVVKRLTAFYEDWWAELEPTFAQTTEIYLGHPDHPVVSLTGHDWIQQALPPWNQGHIRQAYGLPKPAVGNPGPKRKAKQPAVAAKAVHEGHWAVKVLHDGRYEISLRRWPVEADQPITAGLPAGADVPGASQAYRARPGVAIPAVRAVLRVDGRDLESKPVSGDETHVTFLTTLTAGSHRLAPVFITDSGDEVGAYYTVVKDLTRGEI
jgi:arylsulfatase B